MTKIYLTLPFVFFVNVSHASGIKDSSMPQQKYNPDTCSYPKDEASLKKILSPEQFAVAVKGGTEKPFKNAYWNNTHPGIYVDVISKEPLFSSTEKYDSGTGWPSFHKPLAKDLVVEKEEAGIYDSRTEVRSKRANSHLGHVFADGPKTGLRYCINSSSLLFIPLEHLEEKGYGAYMKLFSEKELEYAHRNPYGHTVRHVANQVKD